MENTVPSTPVVSATVGVPPVSVTADVGATIASAKDVIMIVLIIFLVLLCLYLLYKSMRQERQIAQLNRDSAQAVLQDQDVVEILGQFLNEPANRRTIQRWIDPAVGPMVHHYVNALGAGPSEASNQPNQPRSPGQSFSAAQNLDQPPPLEREVRGGHQRGRNSSPLSRIADLLGGLNMGGLSDILGGLGGPQPGQPGQPGQPNPRGPGRGGNQPLAFDFSQILPGLFPNAGGGGAAFVVSGQPNRRRQADRREAESSYAPHVSDVEEEDGENDREDFREEDREEVETNPEDDVEIEDIRE